MLVFLTAIAVALVAIPLVWAVARLIVARILRVPLRTVSLGYPASPGCSLKSWEWRGVEWELSLFPVGVFLGFDDGRPLWRRVLVGAAGPVGAAALAVGTLYGSFLAHAPDRYSTVVLVEGPGPAMDGGLRTGDRVLSIDTVPTPDFATLADVVRPRPQRRVPVVVEREGRQVRLEVILGRRAVGDIDVGLLGVRVAPDAPRIPLADPRGWAWDRTLELIAAAPGDWSATPVSGTGTHTLGQPRGVPWPMLPFLVANFALLFALASVVPLPPFTVGEGLFGVLADVVDDGAISLVRAVTARGVASYLVMSLGYNLALLT